MNHCARILLVLVGVVLAVSRGGAQTTFFQASGGDVFFEAIGWNNHGPFQLFRAEVDGHPRQALIEWTGTSFSINGGPFNLLGSPIPPPFSLGSFAAGDQLWFTFATSQGPVTSAGILGSIANGYGAEMISGDGHLSGVEQRVEFQLTGVNSVGPVFCTQNNRFSPCVPTTVAPEPASILLTATGLIAILLVRSRRRRDQGPSFSVITEQELCRYVRVSLHRRPNPPRHT